MKVMWDMPIITGNNVGANRPDIVIHDSEARTYSLIDMAVPVNRNVNKKVAKKILKYKDVAIELEKMLGTHKHTNITYCDWRTRHYR